MKVMRRYSNNEYADAVVIGTGAGGAPVIARLAKAGLKVVALEAGKSWDAQTDFATDEREQSKLFWFYERLSGGRDPVHFGRNNSGIGVGGSTLHYTAYTPRPRPEDFSIFSEFGIGKDWPIAYADLEPYYDELEAFLGVSGPNPYPWGPPRKTKYPLPPLPLNGAAQLMQRGCAMTGIRTSPAANAAVSAAWHQPHFGLRKACTNRGFCQAGCTTGAKASMDVTFIPFAVHSGAEIRPESFATRLQTDRNGKINSVVYISKDREERQLCKYVFLCAGAVESPRLLLLNGIGNSSGQVGKNFMAHVGIQLWGEFDETIDPYKGIPGGLISEDMHRPADADFAGGYLIQSIGVMPVTYASQMVRATGLWGPDLRQKMRSYNHVAGINIHGECLPYESNYIGLSDERDEMNLPKPRIHFSEGTNEKRIAAHSEKIMRRIWEAAGARNIFKYPRNAHTIGTCCMGTSSERAVVDTEGRSFDVPNLYICDNSVFPGSLSANPALTIMAIALRTADIFLKKQKRMDH
jgi:choline dehydrogenase-like flavoprotein